MLYKVVRIGMRRTKKKRSFTKNLVGIGSVGINGVLDGSLVLLDGDLALASTAGVIIVGGNASGGLGGVLGRHVVCVV